MSDSDHKKKMISLRLSEADYEALRTHYRTYGARNVSDLARLALEHITNGSFIPQDSITAKLADLDDRVHTLESKVSLIEQQKKVTP